MARIVSGKFQFACGMDPFFLLLTAFAFISTCSAASQNVTIEVQDINLFQTNFISNLLSDNLTEDCRKNLENFMQSLNRFELWALKSKPIDIFLKHFPYQKIFSVRCKCKISKWCFEWQHQSIRRFRSVHGCCLKRCIFYRPVLVSNSIGLVQS